MEAKLEAVEQEISQLNVKNQQLTDNLKVKEKVCDDHSDTILQLKQVINTVIMLYHCYHGDLVDNGYKGSHDREVTSHMAGEGTQVTSTIRRTRIDQSGFACECKQELKIM